MAPPLANLTLARDRSLVNSYVSRLERHESSKRGCDKGIACYDREVLSGKREVISTQSVTAAALYWQGIRHESTEQSDRSLVIVSKDGRGTGPDVSWLGKFPGLTSNLPLLHRAIEFTE